MIDSIKMKIIEICTRIIEIGTPYAAEDKKHFYRCLEFLGGNAVEGDILEFGVSGGSSLGLLEKISNSVLREKYGLDLKLFGFDSFEGMPDPQGKDTYAHTGNEKAGIKFNKGEFKVEKQNVIRNLKKQGANLDQITLIEGWYDQTLTTTTRDSLGIKKASLINIDCDFYESTKIVLKWCKSLIHQGTIISFDDYYCFKGSLEHGEILAFREFLDENSAISATPYSKYNWHGQAFIMNRSAS